MNGMILRALTVTMIGLATLSGGADLHAQGRKPSQALDQTSKLQKDLLETFDKDIESGKAQPYEWEGRTEKLRDFAAERAASFKIGDWKGSELLSLATLYQWAEKFEQAAEAYRAYLALDPKARFTRGVDVRASLARALLETERLAEAGKVLDEMYDGSEDNPLAAASRIAVNKDLAMALRDNNQLEDASEWARRGYELAVLADKNRLIRGPVKETIVRDKLSLAALHVAIQERRARKQKAASFDDLVKKSIVVDHPSLLSFYESELAVSRLIGGPAPDIAAERWLEGTPKTLSELRGKVVLLDFWAMWCSPCIAAFPHHRDFLSKFGAKGFEIIGVTKYYGRSDKEGDLSRQAELNSLLEYKRKYQLSYPIAVGKMDDVTNEERYSIISVPTIILIDRQGNVRHIKRGVGEYQKLESRILKLIEENSGR